MKRNITKQWLVALMVVASLLTALPAAAQREPSDIDDWTLNTSFGQNGANLTIDGYSQWDGQSMQEYTVNSAGEIEIRNAAQLARYAREIHDKDSDKKLRSTNVHLLCDIDLGGYYFSITRSNIYGIQATFDGHGHTIRHGYALQSSYFQGYFQGLFKVLKGGYIKDLVVRNYHVIGDGSGLLGENTYAGIICGKASPDWYTDENTNTRVYTGCKFEGIRVIDCSVTGDATGVGGIIGFATEDPDVDGKYYKNGNAIRVDNEQRVQCIDCLIMNCTISTTDDIAGGIIGKATLANIERNRVINTTVRGEDEYAGALLGTDWSVKFSNDFYSKQAQINVKDNLVLNCSVSGDDIVGGAIGTLGTDYSSSGYRFYTIKNNMIHATVDGNTEKKAAVVYGISTVEEFPVSNNYYNTELCTLAPVKLLEHTAAGKTIAEGKTAADMRSFDMGSDSRFKKMENLWPQLQSNYAGDKVITTAAELVALAEEVNNGICTYEGRVVRLGADIDMTGVLMPTIGITDHPFMGEFNGQSHTISNLSITSANDNVGLFGALMNAYVHNVRIDRASILGENHVGVLFGTTVYSPCYISDVLVENSSVSGLGSVGGIGGRVADDKNIAYATIERCYFKGSVTTAYANTNDAAWAGGICGNVLRGAITDCGCVATITRSTQGELKAGLIGGSNGTMTVTRCYATDLNDTWLPLVAGRGSAASVTETNCPKTIAPQDGMQSDLGDNWFYFTVKNDLPIPASLGKYTTDDPTVIEGDFVFYPNNDDATSYYVKEYIGAGGNVTIPATINVSDISKPVTKIYTEVFCERSDVASITLPEGLQYIGNKAFYGTGITSLSLPNSITGLGDMALASCPALASINIGTGVSEVSSNAFINCPNLATITVAAGNTALKAEDGVLFSKSGTSLYVCAAKGAKSGDYTVPSGVNYVYDNAFAYCTQLTSITFPSTMVSSSNDMFIGCDNLRYVDFSQCNDWEQGGWLSSAGVTVRRNPTAVERVIYTKLPFAGLSEQTIIYLPADKSHDANGEKNVVIGNVGTELMLTDGWDFDPKVAFTFPCGSYDRDFRARITTEGYEDKGYTVCLPFAWTLNVEDNSQAKVYAPSVIEDVEGVTTVTFSEVQGGQMAAFTPYYIVVSKGGAYVNAQAGSVEQHQTAGTTVIDGASYQFKGSTATIPNATLYDAQKPAYILQSDGIWYKVPSAEPRAYVGPFRAYFQATMPNSARSLAMMFSGSYNPGEGSGPNAIGPVVRTIDADGTQRVFDLSGRPINGNVKGIVIRNGRKVVRK
ncbi:MAG: leucine-rich repeat domain-containing protein [Prevotella sp.]|nr:leucine-rich repeat domain-containing protein [Prevotella sp.]